MLQLSFQPQPGSGPLYEQLYRAIVSQIRLGQLSPGEKLPGKRSLAQALSMSVNTVDTAYQLLTAEGYLDVRPRSGYYVQACQGPVAASLTSRTASAPATEAPAYAFDLSTGGIDTGLFPFRTWGRIQKELLYSQPQLLDRGHPQGDEDLRCAIADYLQAYRGVDCTPQQIVVGAGVEYLLGLLAPLLPARAAVEDPGYRRVHHILANSGLDCVPAAIDGQGLNPAALEGTGADLVYITPSHQFPTGAVLPASRRAALLQWAAQKPGRYLIEDDYDSEFRFELRPLPSLQGMAGSNGPVVYLSTFSRSLAPSIRIACMVLPQSLMPAFQHHYGQYSSTVSRFEQQTLRVFLQQGHFARHLARCRNRYRVRMQTLTEGLQSRFPGRVHLWGQHTGLHFLMQLQGSASEQQLVAQARLAGVRLQGLSSYSVQASVPPSTLVMGYGSLPDEQISALCSTLGQVWG